MYSTSKLDKASTGGPIVDFDVRNDNFNQGVDGTMKTFTSVFEYFCDVSRRNGYPYPDTIQYEDFNRMHVFNSFEEEFDGDIWSNLSKGIHSTLSECVVAVSSFNGMMVMFSCLLLFILLLAHY
ncbi:hypothetical protein PR202_ga21641 [Eleusine coracana subsp. coracana]|uniref:Uncharacterized protein n=1 Tax=Eleusine coracana subsp. coracana TaxID=191504 RepID=A0AAV5D1H6_ELECO|nr:hypothetical protein PR202_ga21641 [Eleusine coracana subsp. coracana]